MNKPMKILVLRFSSIGDIVLTTPVLRCLKQQIPAADIHFCTKRIYENVLRDNPHVDRFHFLDSSIYKLIEQLRAERYDYIIDLHNNLRTRLIKSFLGARSSSVNKLNWQKWLYIKFKVDIVPDQHIVSRYLDTVSFLGVNDDGFGLDFFIASTDHINMSQLPDRHRFGYVAYAIGGQHATKRLPIFRMIELCQKLNYPVVLLGGTEDRDAGNEVVSALGKDLVYNAAGQFTLGQSASLLRQAKVVFSHDTALMHIAAAFSKKVYSIWGNTTTRLGMYPYRTPYVVLENKGLACRPCSKIGSTKCPVGHFKCMNELPFAFNAENLIPRPNVPDMEVTEK